MKSRFLGVNREPDNITKQGKSLTNHSPFQQRTFSHNQHIIDKQQMNDLDKCKNLYASNPTLNLCLLSVINSNPSMTKMNNNEESGHP
jgi:hypothetical protein